MSIEYVIDNHQTKQFLYCNSAFSHIDREHLIGGEKVIEENLLQYLYFRPEYREYHIKYCIYMAHILSKFIGTAKLEDIHIHTDEWFRDDYTQLDIDTYMTEYQLDKWIMEND